MRLIEPGTKTEFEGYYALRWRVLRSPWGGAPGSERDPTDDDSLHLMLIDDGDQPLAVGRLHFNSTEEAHIRFLAVEEHCRGRGLGRRLMAALEERASAQGARRVVLDARENAVSFYLRLGYVDEGPVGVRFGNIPHRRMIKTLPDT
ncbi:MAG TPA: GNAT family N-acetyltransferase [Methylomirabilota bacterium]|nr:GNAT family N-acetyltransferase [Methylomirabilota bacterium]